MTITDIRPQTALPFLDVMRLDGGFSAARLHELVNKAIETCAHERMGSRTLYVVRDGKARLGIETCQSSVNMRLVPSLDVGYFDTNPTVMYHEVYVQAMSSAEPEKRSCVCHHMPADTIASLRAGFINAIRAMR